MLKLANLHQFDFMIAFDRYIKSNQFVSKRIIEKYKKEYFCITYCSDLLCNRDIKG